MLATTWPAAGRAARRRRRAVSQRQMLAEVPEADVILVNPTHIAIALRYDRKTMKAPKIAGKKLTLAPILRAGVGFLDGMLALIPSR